MIRRWLALTYYLYALRLAALSHFILIHYTCRVGIYAHAVQYVGFRQPETVYYTGIWQSYRKTDMVAACAFRIRRQPETVFRLPLCYRTTSTCSVLVPPDSRILSPLVMMYKSPGFSTPRSTRNASTSSQAFF